MDTSIRLAAVILVTAGFAWAGELNMDWAYHDDGDGLDDRATERVPGTTETFLGNETALIHTDDPVEIFVLTANQFAGEQEEQVYVRWWNGVEEHWVAAEWAQNVKLGPDTGTGTFHGQPLSGEIELDVWKATIGADVTRPGENFYVIQVKGWGGDGAETVNYLLQDSSESSKANLIEQIWTSDTYFGHDWSVSITDKDLPDF